MKIFTYFSLFICLLLSLAGPAKAQESAQRQPDENWQDALARQTEKTLHSIYFDSGETALSAAQPYTPAINLDVLPVWDGSAVEFQMAYEKVRDEKFFPDPRRPQVWRRASWLYPDDGCYVRASHVVRSLERQGRPLPGKVFVFGNLRVKTSFTSTGMVWWSYHVAAAYRFGTKALILDPAVDPHQPLFLEDWLARISKDPAETRVSICDSNSYSPGVLCIGASPVTERRVINHQKPFLGREWDRLEFLNMNPERLLGDEPPWTRLIFGPHGLALEGLN